MDVGTALLLLAAAAAGLGNDDPEARDAASAALRRAGAAARPLLERLQRSGDAEVRARAGDLIEAIRRRSQGARRGAKSDVVPVTEDDPLWKAAAATNPS